MNSPGIAEIYIVLNSGPQLRQSDTGFDFDVPVFQRPPEMLHFRIVAAATAHAHVLLLVKLSRFRGELDKKNTPAKITRVSVSSVISLYQEPSLIFSYLQTSRKDQSA